MTIHEHHLEALRKGVLDEFTRDMSTCLIATTPMRRAEHARNWRWKLTPLNGVPAEDALLKSQGVRLPGKAVGNRRWRSWSWDVATRLEESVGEDRVLAYHGITTMLNLGYREHFAPLPVLPEHESIARSYPSWACCPGLEPNE